MADIKIGIMRKCPQVRTYIKEIERAVRERAVRERAARERQRQRQRERINFVLNEKIPLRNDRGSDDKQHAFILFGNGDSLLF